MKHKLSVVVRAFVDSRAVQVIATGCLTEATQQALHALIQRARRLDAGVDVIVDLTALDHVEAAGVDLLRWATEHDDPQHVFEPVHFLLPPGASSCPAPADLIDARGA